jgi:sugar phosphate isomerase/epimerase
MIPRALASTTSHKAEPWPTTFEIFARLDLRDIEINLHHVIDKGVDPAHLRRALDAHELRAWTAAGGWCDFFHEPPRIDDTFRSIDRQVAAIGVLGADTLRIFFGRLAANDYDDVRRDTIVANLQELAARHPRTRFVLENHDGASLRPEICREILERVDRPNIRMNFDPINFERGGVNSRQALEVVRPFIAHVHLKGLEAGEYCELGVGDVDLGPVIDSLMQGGYAGQFGVEYEGTHDKTLRLYQSMQRARALLGAFASVGGGL